MATRQLPVTEAVLIFCDFPWPFFAVTTAGFLQQDLKKTQLDARMQQLHETALTTARDLKRVEAALMDALIAVERERVFMKLGFSSLFTYAVQALGLSESVAYSVISVARKSREVPALRVEIQEGAISISKAKKIVSVLTAKNQQEWLAKAKTLTTRHLEKEVARENPRASVPERAIYTNGKRLALSLGVD